MKPLGIGAHYVGRHQLGAVPHGDRERDMLASLKGFDSDWTLKGEGRESFVD